VDTFQSYGLYIPNVHFFVTCIISVNSTCIANEICVKYIENFISIFYMLSSIMLYLYNYFIANSGLGSFVTGALLPQIRPNKDCYYY
jgi:hypothetical protein